MRGYVTAGGRSGRFGSDKARAELGGRTLVERAVELLRAATDAVTVICAPGASYGDLGLPCIEDARPGLGPMSALHTALLDAGEGEVALMACDLLGADPSWFDLLKSERGDALAAAFRTGELWQPVFAIYDTRLLQEVERRLDAGMLSMQPLLTEVATAVPSPPDFSRMKSIDTPEDLAEYERFHA